MSLSEPLKKVITEFDTLGHLLQRQEDQAWTAHFHGLTLRTALQPIFSISHKRTIGYEALIRAFDTDGAAVLPVHLFGLPNSEMENVMLDRLCRYLHVRNFASIRDDINWLFLNVSPKAVAGGTRFDAFFGQLLRATGFPPHRIVMEIVEQPTDDAGRLRDTVEYYRKLGCLTAIDDFGAGHSNFERIWNLAPDIVKLDRQILVRAIQEKRARQILRGIVSLLHQSGCLVLLEGVETRDQALLAVDAGVDFVQGFFFHTPSIALDEVVASAADFDGLLNDYRKNMHTDADPTQQIASYFDGRFRAAIRALQDNRGFSEACQELLRHHTVSRCYLIGNDGVQIDNTVVSAAVRNTLDPRFRPLENTASADWYRQHYLRRALQAPGQLQVTRPYLSVTGAHMCVTLSCAFRDGDTYRVLCCDILSP